MSDDFDLDRIADIPDPVAGLGSLSVAPLRAPVAPPSPTRERVRALRATALGAALLYEGAWLAIMNKRDDLHTMGRARLVAEIAIPLVAALVALVAATAPGARGLGKTKAHLATLALLSPAFFVVSTILLASGSSTEPDTGSFCLHCLNCFAWTSLYGAGPMVFAGWAFRRSFVVAPAWHMAALAMACAGVGMATMTLVCSTGTPAHVLLGHGSVMLVGALVGAALGRRIGEV